VVESFWKLLRCAASLQLTGNGCLGGNANSGTVQINRQEFVKPLAQTLDLFIGHEQHRMTLELTVALG
jgi:hypothetical protein